MDRVRRGRPTPGWEARFLKDLERSHNVTYSAERAGVGVSTAYRKRLADAAFADSWDEILATVDLPSEGARA